MTQQGQREVIVLVAAAVAFARSVFPKPIIERATKEPYRNQVIARLCYVAFTIFLLLVWYGIHGEGLPVH
jgi:hypothetical protein